VEIFSWLAAMVPASPDWVIFGGNAMLSALTATLVFVFARCAGIQRRVAVAAAALLAIDPITIRFAATESYFPIILFLCVAAAVGLLVAGRALGAGMGWQASFCVTGAALLLVQAARVHPSAWLPVALVPILLCAGSEGRFRLRGVALLGGALVICGVGLATSADGLVHVLENVRAGVLMRRPAPLSAWPIVVAAALVAVCAVNRQTRWLAPAAGLSVAALLMTRHMYGQSLIWQQSYDRLFLPVPVIAVVAAVLTPFAHRTWLVGAMALVTAGAWLGIAPSLVSFRTTDHLEYRWLRDQLRQVPHECRIVHLAAAGHRGVEIPTYVRPRSSPAVALDPRRPHGYDDAFSPAPCIYYVHTSLCSSVEARTKCAAIEDGIDLEIVAREAFPARPSSGYIPYDRDPVETWIGRVRP
jgi:hypothetical protein